MASYVTAGSMLADRVRGGTFIVGGKGTGADGQILVERSDGTVVGVFDKNGIKIGGFTVDSKGGLTTSDSIIRFGEHTYIDDEEADFGDWIFDADDTLYGPSVEQYWDKDGNLHTAEIYLTGSWWKGWSITETVQQLWDDHKSLYNYVHSGSWNPCSDAMASIVYVMVVALVMHRVFRTARSVVIVMVMIATALVIIAWYVLAMVAVVRRGQVYKHVSER